MSNYRMTGFGLVAIIRPYQHSVCVVPSMQTMLGGVRHAVLVSISGCFLLVAVLLSIGTC
jgi:hypothetical protein